MDHLFGFSCMYYFVWSSYYSLTRQPKHKICYAGKHWKQRVWDRGDQKSRFNQRHDWPASIVTHCGNSETRCKLLEQKKVLTQQDKDSTLTGQVGGVQRGHCFIVLGHHWGTWCPVETFYIYISLICHRNKIVLFCFTSLHTKGADKVWAF